MTAGGFKYRRFGNEKLPEEAHLLVLAGRCSTYGAQREPLMLIAVRGGASRCFQRRKARSAALSRRLRRCVPRCAAAAAFPSPATRSRPFDPAAVRLSRLFCAPTRLFVCFRLACRLAGREGRRGVLIIAIFGSILGDARRPHYTPGLSLSFVMGLACLAA